MFIHPLSIGNKQTFERLQSLNSNRHTCIHIHINVKEVATTSCFLYLRFYWEKQSHGIFLHDWTAEVLGTCVALGVGLEVGRAGAFAEEDLWKETVYVLYEEGWTQLSSVVSLAEIGNEKRRRRSCFLTKMLMIVSSCKTQVLTLRCTH